MVFHSIDESTSTKMCRIVIDEAQKIIGGVKGSIIEIRSKHIYPCEGCGKCFETHRCIQDDDFNLIYSEIIKADILFVVSPHYAPIPAKLAALLEKMEQITFLHWGKDNSYKSEVYGKHIGIISHGGGETWALKSYKSMVNDTIANALGTIQMRVIPFNSEWDTGLSLPVKNAAFVEDSIFPYQEYDWEHINTKISEYVKKAIKMTLR